MCGFAINGCAPSFGTSSVRASAEVEDVGETDQPWTEGWTEGETLEGVTPEFDSTVIEEDATEPAAIEPVAAKVVT